MTTRDAGSTKARASGSSTPRANGSSAPRANGASAAPRYQRPAIERARPRRHAALAFTAPAPGDTKSADAGVLERAVQLAYRVCDEYLRGGQMAAAAMKPDPAKARTNMADDTTNPMAMMLSMWTQMGRLWIGAMMPFMNGGAQATDIFGNPIGHPGAHPGAASPGPASGPVPVDVTVKVTSSRPVVVQLHMLDRAKTSNLAIGALKHIDGADKGALTAVYLEELKHGVSVNVTVPREQAAATYRGAFTDSVTREVRGTLTITVSDPV